MRRNKWLQGIILLVIVIVGGYAVSQSFTHATAVMKSGDRAPDFRLLGLDGEVHDLAEYRGKPLVLNFWGTFCRPCRNEMPAIQTVYEKWKDQGVAVVGVNLSEDKLSVDSFVRQVGAHFPILLDRGRQIEKKYGLKQYPTTFFIRPDGVIQDVVIGGPMSVEDIETHIRQLQKS